MEANSPVEILRQRIDNMNKQLEKAISLENDIKHGEEALHHLEAQTHLSVGIAVNCPSYKQDDPTRYEHPVTVKLEQVGEGELNAVKEVLKKEIECKRRMLWIMVAEHHEMLTLLSQFEFLDKNSHDCWACTHHLTGKCDTFCDHGESFEQRLDVKGATPVNLVELAKRCCVCGLTLQDIGMCNGCQYDKECPTHKPIFFGNGSPCFKPAGAKDEVKPPATTLAHSQIDALMKAAWGDVKVTQQDIPGTGQPGQFIEAPQLCESCRVGASCTLHHPHYEGDGKLCYQPPLDILPSQAAVAEVTGEQPWDDPADPKV